MTHSRNKPFSDPNCGRYLADFGALMMLLGTPPRSIVDFGCGTGWTSIFLARAGYQVLGVDIAENAIAAAQETAAAAALSNIAFQCADYEEFRCEHLFDCAFFYDALHHAEDEQAAVNAAFRALKPDGVLFTMEPGEGHSMAEVARNAVAQYGVHEKDMPPNYIWKLGQRAGFQRKLILPLPNDAANSIYCRDSLYPKDEIRLAAKLVRGIARLVAKSCVAGTRGGLLAMWK